MSSSMNIDPKLANENFVDVSKIDLQQEIDKFRFLKHEVSILKARLQGCERGNPGNTKKFPNEFENICFDMLKPGLRDEFEDFQIDKQVNSRSELGNIIEVTDIELLNNGRVDGTFWNTVYNDYESQRIVFECKNLTEAVDDRNIFQLYMYLGKSVGRFGVILSRQDCEKYNTKKDGLTESAFKALRRLHEDAKYMIWIWGESEICSYLDHCRERKLRKFFNDQKALFLSKIR